MRRSIEIHKHVRKIHVISERVELTRSETLSKPCGMVTIYFHLTEDRGSPKGTKMPLTTRMTRQLGIRHPIISAPMAFAAGGKLAAAVSAAGGLGLIGGGYGDTAWLERELVAAGDQTVGVGFITWSLRKKLELLDQVLCFKPKAVCLSFDDPAPFADRIKQQGIALICQVQTRRDAERAISCGADMIVAQGS
ncbi:MAG: nitronate monooxygenase, partial [Hyphomicrobium sp.]